MSTSQTVWYQQAYIPCPHPDHAQSVADGKGAVNIDGKVITGGTSANGKCYQPTHSVFSLGSGSTTAYKGNTVLTTNNVNTAKAIARGL